MAKKMQNGIIKIILIVDRIMYPKKACAEGNNDNGNLERDQICKNIATPQINMMNYRGHEDSQNLIEQPPAEFEINLDTFISIN